MAAKRMNSDWLHRAISWGASIVIVGVLFKILHIGGSYANIIIGVGLGIEAILFFVTGFFPPVPEPAWDRVYPELSDDFTGDRPDTSSRHSLAAVPTYSNTAALDKMMADANIGPELIARLGNGLSTFADKVSSISRAADVSEVSQEFSTKMRQANGGLERLNQAFMKADAQLMAFTASNDDAKAYHHQVNSLAKNLSALNAVYELELQDANAHLKSMNKFYQNLSLTMNNFSESMEDSRQFKEEVAKLAGNLASLNAVYGNMLSAMNHPRV